MELTSELILERKWSCEVPVKWCKRGNPNSRVLGELRRKKGEKGLREREDEEKERAEKLGEREKGSDRERERSKRVRNRGRARRGIEGVRETE